MEGRMSNYDDNSVLPKPGEIIHYDFRERNDHRRDNIRMLQWNIERGYKLKEILDNLTNLDADVLCLQELDIGCERTGGIDIGITIAKHLKLNYYFLCEFEELHSPLRDKWLQGGGVHGNAIMTKFDVDAVWKVDHKYQPYDWNKDGHLKNEPRRGRRSTLACTIATSQGKCTFYSVHLEVFCGILGRICQISEVLQDCRAKKLPMQVIMGDLNTIGHSICRLSPNYCNDILRWRTLGYTEAQWWQKYILSFTDQDGEENTNLKNYGLPKEVVKACRNPSFYDPFDVYNDETLNNLKYYGLVRGKLDWLLMRGWDTLEKSIGNHDYSASDHKYLLVVAKPGNNVNHTKKTSQESNFGGFFWTILMIALVAFVVFNIKA